MKALPSLRGLEAFRAAMRQGGFHAAARALGLTPSAVSHRIRELERVLGAPLFERRNRRVVPTDAAHRYFEALQEGFDRLDAATRAVAQPSGAEILAIHAAPSLAAQWLLPRLKGFIAAHPEIVVRLSSTPDAVRFGDDVYDIDLQYARPVPFGCDSLAFPEETVLPLCAPDFAGPDGRPPRRGADLAEATLLHSTRNLVQWPEWFAEFAPALPLPPRAMQFDRSFMAIAAAADGLGVALESRLLAERELRSGRLITPLGEGGLTLVAHRAVWARRSRGARKIHAFTDWLARELGLQ